jgi:hypothetical protein
LGAIATLNRKRHNKDWHIPEDIKWKRLEELSWRDLTTLLS